jgi:predicted glycogen debranching enzyme
MVPNRFDDYAPLAHYNSIDASLQFCLAAERYLAAGGQKRFWKNVLLPAMETILRRYREGTRFDIRADADGLLAGGSIRTQLTWMDAALGEEVVTPRHGKAVEVNALWYFAHRCLAERLAADVPASAAHYAELADQIGESFRRAFWYEQGGHLYDCITDGTGDASLRPNQIFAVSLPHSPLQPHRQRAVVDACRRDLLTPYGLRTLSPHDPRYRRRYGNSWESRDRSYHQGTVWAWLMGPFIEAYMKVNGGGRDAVEQARRWLAAFEGHLREAGLGSVSEIFDGDAPHAPRGCYAQAWSVGEVLRARRLVDRAAAAE